MRYTILLILLSTFIKSSAVIIKGEIQNIDDIGIYQLIIKSENDSIVRDFDSRYFITPINANSKLSISIHSFGYEDLYFTFNKIEGSDTIDLGDLTLREETHMLDEVFVTAKKAKIEREGRNYTITNLSGTHLGEAGAVYDMLGWIPGVMTYDINNITISGTTSIGAIYLNDQKVTDRNLLLSIPSNQVAKVEIIKDPGVRYTGPVIKITLKKQLKDYVGLSITNNLDVRRKFSDDGWINLSGKTGKFSFNGSIVGEYVNRKVYYGGETTINNKTENNGYSKYFDSKYTAEQIGSHWTIGANYMANTRLNLMLQYSGNSTNVDFEELKCYSGSQQNLQTQFSEFLSVPHRKTNSHNITSGFTYNIKEGQMLNMTLSYSHRNNNEIQDREINTYLNNRSVKKKLCIESIYDLWDFETNYNFNFLKSDIGIGYNLGVIKNEYNFINNSYNQSTLRNDITNAFYLSWSKRFNLVKIDMGGRLLFNNTQLTQLAIAENYSEDNSIVFRPYALINYDINNDYAIGSSYSMYVAYPTITQLNPAIIYNDTLHYSSGNPKLNAMKSHVFNVYSNLKNVSIDMEYRRINSMIITAYFPYGTDGSIISKPINSDYTNYCSFGISYNANIYDFRVNAEGKYSYQYTKLPQLDGLLNSSYSQHNIYLSCDVSRRFWGNADAYVRVSYMSPWYDSNKRIGETLGINLGVSKMFFDNKLRVAFELQDLAAKETTPYWELEFNGICQWQRNRYDTRGAKLSLRYTFNSIKTRYKKANINKTTEGRAQ